MTHQIHFGLRDACFPRPSVSVPERVVRAASHGPTLALQIARGEVGRSLGWKRSTTPKLLIAHPDRSFLGSALQKLRGLDVVAEAVSDPSLVLHRFDVMKPQIAVVAESFLDAIASSSRMALGPALSAAQLLVVYSDEPIAPDRSRKLASFGAVGAIRAAELLTGRLFPDLLVELLRIQEGGSGRGA